MCSNGGLCKECCDEFQRKGLLPSCGYSQHNYSRRQEEVKDILQIDVRKSNTAFQSALTSSPASQPLLSVPRAANDSFFSPDTTRTSSISPYHALGGSKFTNPSDACRAPRDKSVQFRLIWYNEVREQIQKITCLISEPRHRSRSPTSSLYRRKMVDSARSMTQWSRDTSGFTTQTVFTFWI